MLLNVIERGPDVSSEATTLPPVVLLHGLFGRARNLGFVQRRLAATRRTLALDLRNHGDSPHGPMSFRIMADDVRETLEHYNALPAMLLGHSMGGKTAMMLALRHPECVHSLLVVDIAPGEGGFTRMEVPAELETLDFPPHLDRAGADALLRPLIPSEAIRQMMVQNMRLGDNPGWSIGLADIMTALPTIMSWPDLPPGTQYDGPTLFIRGEISPYIQPKNYPAMRRLFPHYTLETISGAGHWVHVDAPKRFAELVEKFAKR
ncbi:alpha/beta fold hydrolase [Acetobacter cerevisiae]|uniref:Esterase n=1 Tax=Acetobacter cerevisiae TaxID=178900 RepID=A0A149V7N5_9PROT|nr:alpha/beta fold hydrolase [Acetobacter cerevisiae]KXV76126.1 esterase [Acetobacter cerevisiae]